MNKRTPIQWVKDWWEAINDGIVLWPMFALLVIIILTVILVSQK